MRRMIVVAGLALLAACTTNEQKPKVASASSPSRPVATAINLSACPALPPLTGNTPLRTQPVDLTRAAAQPREKLQKLLASNAGNLAASGLSGGIHCVDIRRMTDIGGIKLHQRDRFVSFPWEGYQAEGFRSDGTILIDRIESGKHIDVGGEPVFSPAGVLFAAVHQSPTAFSALEGFGVWQVGPYAVVQVGKIDDLPEMLDWRIDRWESETCVALSAIPFTRAPITSTDLSSIARDRFVAKRRESGWVLTPAASGGC